MGGLTLIDYDENGNIIKVENADKGISYYKHDLFNRLVKYTDPENYALYHLRNYKF